MFSSHHGLQNEKSKKNTGNKKKQNKNTGNKMLPIKYSCQTL
jgi:hypothetical protein